MKFLLITVFFCSVTNALPIYSSFDDRELSFLTEKSKYDQLVERFNLSRRAAKGSDFFEKSEVVKMKCVNATKDDPNMLGVFTPVYVVKTVVASPDEGPLFPAPSPMITFEYFDTFGEGTGKYEIISETFSDLVLKFRYRQSTSIDTIWFRHDGKYIVFVGEQFSPNFTTNYAGYCWIL